MGCYGCWSVSGASSSVGVGEMRARRMAGRSGVLSRIRSRERKKNGF